tara:strand:+ start:459 stop:662 length:204 start_codon:yes stop_codon:yes gene_type:complete
MQKVIIPETPAQALTLALKLSIQAPTDRQALDLIYLAERIGSRMSEETVELCRLAAIEAVQYEATYQ